MGCRIPSRWFRLEQGTNPSYSTSGFDCLGHSITNHMILTRITPNHITTLKPHEVFVFGSNEAGRHGRGAALTAQQWGACKSVAAGRSGQTYAIPTKPADVRVRLCLRDISKYVDDFIQHAQGAPKRLLRVWAGWLQSV